MIGLICHCSCSVDTPIGDRLLIGNVSITVFALSKPIAGHLGLVIDTIGVIAGPTPRFAGSVG
jgi:hypothetical protein